MNTLTDLRRTLDQHADDVADPAAVARTAAVHHRISVVRRRRQAVSGGALALVLAAVGLTALQVRQDAPVSPTGPVVLGERAPGSIRSLGYAYDATGRTQVIDGSGTIEVAGATTPRLLSWTLRDASSVRFTLPGDEVHRTEVSHFRDFLYVPAGQAASIPVRVAGGSVGVATYALSDRVTPPGYTEDGVTYRSTVAGTPLLTARIEDGTTELTTSYVEPHGQVRIAVMCSGLPHGYTLNVSLNGQGRISSGGAPCDSDGTFDPGASAATQIPQHHPGRLVRMRVWISTSMRDATPVPAARLPHLRMGVGVYGPVDMVGVGGWVQPRTIEAQGHTWTVGDVNEGRSGRVLALARHGSDRLATVAWHTHGRTTVSFRTDHTTPAGSGSAGGGKAAISDLWVPATTMPRASLRRGEGTFGIVAYDRVD
ncbi:MAG TPA: hypothetical protein VFJ89_09615 [Nocardioides sp.]|nr:hypothetical protein [Nocardioides sp.]